jgi:dTDP-4-dehydrorhamnose reductase
LSAISTKDFGALAPRPADSVLNTDKYHSLGGPSMPTWRDALAEYFRVERSKAGDEP